jgi:DNA-binding transcriptional ArsR family regulator
MAEQSAEPSDALDVLSDETRVRIIRTLAEADEPLAFAELRRAVGVDDAGRFNYHLSLVCEHFVRERESGYELAPAGARLVTAADVDLADETSDPLADEDVCPVCGEADCGKLFHVHLSPPSPSEYHPGL